MSPVVSADEIWAILLAGGSGLRYSQETSKLLEPLENRPILQHSLDKLQAHTALCGIVLVTHPDWESAYRQHLQFSSHLQVRWATGGETRRASVWQGLLQIPERCHIVIVHDGARPLVSPDAIQRALAPVISGKAAGTSLGVPVQNTIKETRTTESGVWVQTTLCRESLWQVHTPQIFLKSMLVDAHQAVPHDIPIYDDASLVEKYTQTATSIQMILDDISNIKITTPKDFRLAQAFLMVEKEMAGIAP